MHGLAFTSAMSSGAPLRLQSLSITPSPLTSLEVWIPGVPLRSVHSVGSLAILVADDCTPKARLATHTSPLKSTAVRDGAFELTLIVWCGPSARLFWRLVKRRKSSFEQQPLVPSHAARLPVGLEKQVTVR